MSRPDETTDSDQVQVRLKKRERLFAEGIDPYPHSFKVTHPVETLVRDFDSLETSAATVTTASRVRAQRGHGDLQFIDLAAGRLDPHIQVVVERGKLTEEERKQLDALDLGDWLGVSGACRRTKRGERSVMAASVRLLCKSVRPLPNFKGASISDPELMARQPELEMLFERKRAVLRSRCAAVRAVRDLLLSRGATEVDTPYLNPFFGGASARPFRTNVWALDDQEMYLAISPEIEDKRLIVGGFTEGVFTFARNFRNEGIDATHNPEFNALEVYLPFNDVNDMMLLTEEIFAAACKAVHGATRCTWQGKELDFTPPWPRLPMLAAVEEATGLAVGSMSKAELAAACAARGLDRSMDLDKTGQGNLANRVVTVGLKTQAPPASMKGDELRALIGRHKLHSAMDLTKEWDFLVTGLFERFVEPNLTRPCHVILHPARTTVLCKKARDVTLANGESLIERCESYAAGMEITNAYSELNDPVIQRRLVEEQAGRREGGDEEAMPMNELFVQAIEFGLPTCGGLGVGIDRMAMLLTDSAVIREVIAFPLVKR